MQLVFVVISAAAVWILTESGVDGRGSADEKFAEDKLVDSEEASPDVLIAVFGSNRQYFLPYLLGAVEKLEYPKDRLALWVHEEVPTPDDKTDSGPTSTFSQKWFDHFRDQFHASSVSTKGLDDNDRKAALERQNELHEAALALARDIHAGAVLFLDPSCMLFEPGMLRELQLLDGDIVAPLLASYSRYTNYWCKMNDDGEYVMSDACEKNRKFEVQGELSVDSVHSCYMLKSEKALTQVTYRVAAVGGLSRAAEANAAINPAALLGLVARRLSLQVVVSNKRLYGYMIPPSYSDNLYSNEDQDWDQLATLQLFFYTKDRYELLRPSSVPTANASSSQKVGANGRPRRFPSAENGLPLSKVFVINLDRRPDRMDRMRQSLGALGIGYTRVAAVDGRLVNDEKLENLGIDLLPEYRDPHRKRPMTRGEIGCFLSHYNIWQQITADGTTSPETSVLVLEDDIRFVPYFTRKLDMLLADMRRMKLEWDLIYIGRKRLINSHEPHLAGSIRLVHVDYSYWTLGYLITARGAQKLLDARPLERLLPVDEFLPIMFNRHPELQWSAHFAVRNLSAYSAAPLLVEPLFFTGEAEYVSDTEDSLIVGGIYVADNQQPNQNDADTDDSEDEAGFERTAILSAASHDEL